MGRNAGGQTFLCASAHRERRILVELRSRSAEGGGEDAGTQIFLAVAYAHYSKPKLLIVDELGYLPFELRS